MHITILLSIIITGFSGIVAQIILLRELFVIFQGNELSIGIILANWLFLEAIGSFYLGKKIEFWADFNGKISVFIISLLLFSGFLPLSVYLARILKTFLNINPAEGAGIVQIWASTFFLMSPVSIIHGALFTFGCRIYDEFNKDSSKSVARIYIYETLGTALGGIIFGYFLVMHFNSFETVFLVAAANTLSCIYFAAVSRNRFLTSVSVFIFCLVVFLCASENVEKLHRLSVNKQWQNQEVVFYNNSVYGNISVIKNGEQFTFFSNGTPIITSPVPDIVHIEDTTHFAMLSHPHPQKVLIISGGAGGRIYELLKYKTLKKIDYVEQDPLLLKTIEKFPTTLTKKEFSNPIVKVHYVDGRLFVRNTKEKYDVIFVGISDVKDLLSNRFHTMEFYEMLKNRLSDGGIVSINFPGSLVYLADDLARLNNSILGTLKTVFPAVRIIPGDFNIFLCFKDNVIAHLSSEELYMRFVNRKIKSNVLTKSYIDYRLDKKWLMWFLENLEKVKAERNYDFKPMAMFYQLSYWSVQFSPLAGKIFQVSGKIRLWMFIVFFLTFLMVILLIKYKNYLRYFVMPYAICTTGFAGMLFDLVLIFGFQVLYGYVYHQLGLLISFFMLGTIFGGGIIADFLRKIPDKIKFFVQIERLIILFSVFLFLVLVFLQEVTITNNIAIILPFLSLSFTGGFLIGAEFPLAFNIYLPSGKDVSSTSGLLYASDLIGGFFGGILGGVVLLPVLGFFQTVVMLVMLKLTSIVFLKLYGQS